MGSGKAALGFGLDRIRTLVCMTTGSSHAYGYHGENALAPSFLIEAGNKMKISDEFEIRQDPTKNCGFERLEKSLDL